MHLLMLEKKLECLQINDKIKFQSHHIDKKNKTFSQGYFLVDCFRAIPLFSSGVLQILVVSPLLTVQSKCFRYNLL